jgi:hypothetical protein
MYYEKKTQNKRYNKHLILIRLVLRYLWCAVVRLSVFYLLDFTSHVVSGNYSWHISTVTIGKSLKLDINRTSFHNSIKLMQL